MVGDACDSFEDLHPVKNRGRAIPPLPLTRGSNWQYIAQLSFSSHRGHWLLSPSPEVTQDDSTRCANGISVTRALVVELRSFVRPNWPIRGLQDMSWFTASQIRCVHRPFGRRDL